MAALRDLAMAFLAFPLLGLALHVSLADKLRGLSLGARDILRTTIPTSAPNFVIYQDAWTSLPSASQLQGYNVYALSVWLDSGAADMALAWELLTIGERTSYLQEYNAAGISLIVSAFGATSAPTSSGINAVSIASNLASWVLQYGVQGVDVDYEDFNAFNHGGGSAEPWLISFTQQIRVYLPQGEYILSHTPVAPWFSPFMWSGGGYLAVHNTVGALIDWYNIQFYNQGISEYTTCSGLLFESSSFWPESALFQIADNGVSLDKLLIGKPGTVADATNGYMDPVTLASCVAQAHSYGWNAGVMVWQYPHVGSSWISTVRGNTWPVVSSSPTSTTAASVPTPTIPSGNGNCAGVPTWMNNAVYVRGNEVTYDGRLWIANQWNQDEVPGGASGAWDNGGMCI